MESWEIALQKRQAIVNDVINTLESIINNGITNIRLYNGNGFNGYLFKSVNKWYKFIYVFNYGTTIKLLQGDEEEDINTVLFQTFKIVNRSCWMLQFNKILDKVKQLYILQKSVNGQTVRFIDLIDQCESIEKLSEDIFTLKLQKQSARRNLCFERIKNITNYKYITTHLNVSHYKYNELVNIIYESDDESFISSVFDMLNAIYYLNKASRCITLDNIINLISVK